MRISRNRVWTDDMVAVLVTHYQAGKPIDWIAERLETTTLSCRMYLNRNGIRKFKERAGDYEWIQNATTQEIIHKLGVSKGVARVYRQRARRMANNKCS